MTLIELVRQDIQNNLAERANLETQLDAILTPLETEGRSTLTEVEQTQFNQHRDAIRALDEARTALDARLAELEADAKAREDAARRAAELPTLSRDTVQVRHNEAVYRRDGQHSWLRDLYMRTFNPHDTASAERLARHQLEQRATVTAGMAGAVPPVYLVDEYAAIARAGRPFLNSLNVGQLPEAGVSFVVPRGNTGNTGAQTAEGAGFQDGDLANVDVTNLVNLSTSKTDISRTLFERGGPIVDSILFPDLMGAAEVANNVSALNGSGIAPQHRGVLQVAGINAVTYTDATPTVGELWPKIADAIQRINTLRFLPATAIYMHPRRWGWITAAVDTTGRPLFEFSMTPPNSVVGLGVAAEYGQVVGTLQGLPVITDASIPTNLGAGTNEDIIIVARALDLRYWEDDMMQFTFEQANSTAPGQVRLAVGRFALCVFGRYPTAISTIGGTGLISPSF